MERAAPPRASPSNFVRMTPVRPSRLWNSPAERTASWPIMASAMNSISLGCNSFFSTESSFIKSSSMCKRPAVSTRMTSLAESFASLITAHNLERLVRACARPQRNADGFGDLRELFAGSGAIHVRGDHYGAMPVLRQPFGQLARGGGFARTLQAHDHPHRR